MKKITAKDIRILSENIQRLAEQGSPEEMLKQLEELHKRKRGLSKELNSYLYIDIRTQAQRDEESKLEAEVEQLQKKIDELEISLPKESYPQLAAIIKRVYESDRSEQEILQDLEATAQKRTLASDMKTLFSSLDQRTNEIINAMKSSSSYREKKFKFEDIADVVKKNYPSLPASASPEAKAQIERARREMNRKILVPFMMGITNLGFTTIEQKQKMLEDDLNKLANQE